MVFDFIDFAVRPVNAALFLADFVWFIIYASRGWSRLKPYRRRLSYGVMMMLFAGALGSAESFRRDVEVTYVSFFVLLTGLVVLSALWIGRDTPIEDQ